MNMKIRVFTIMLLVPAWLLAETTADLDTDEQKMSYAVGLQIGQSLIQDGIQVDGPALSQGIVDSLEGREPRVPIQELQQILERQQKLAKAEQASIAQKNVAAGEKFLEKNRTAEGVKELPSGLQYIVLEEGSGKSPKSTDTVTVDYRGTLINGTEFDSSFKRGEPATFPVNAVIKGWQQALPMMREGGKWRIFVPADLAYGPQGAGATIGPNETLIFDIELHSIK